ncbi:MAG: aldehyde dehydrogenase [Thermoleophilia bacterium]|nr:aldehyde dehydrogenase [Thermoleophilia bacterium]
MRIPTHPLPVRAAAALPELAAMGLDERLARAAATRRRLEAEGPRIVDLAVAEAGIPRRFAAREVTSALLLLDALPELAESIRPQVVPSVSGQTTLEWAPYGVVLGWHAANSPVWVPALVVVSALVGGNAVVSRPSQRVRRTTLAVLDVLAADWPEDAVAVADLPGPEAEALVCDPGIHAVVAHASTETCKRHLRRLGEAYSDGVPLRPYIPEASGNDALIVLPGADLEHVARAAALGGFANAGQLCMSAKRMIVHEDIWPQMAPLLAAAVGELVVGDPAAPDTDIGPLLPGPAQANARAALAQALAAGGRVVVGAPDPGERLAPTVVLLPRDGLSGLELWRTEMFAPVRGLVLCRSAGEALDLANDTPFGLGAALFGGTDADRELLAHGLRAARVLIDEGPMYQDPHLVVGGVGDSGLAGARPKLEQLVWARRVHRAGGHHSRSTVRIRQAGR